MKSVWLRLLVAFIRVASTLRAAAARRTRSCASSTVVTRLRCTPLTCGHADPLDCAVMMLCFSEWQDPGDRRSRTISL
eukprot:CAMPEP_0119201280 /NCGR_PEP_ID=MMETSP1316-20130426/28627_1 /TAXON_ID=41880 /ORGANISM="Pycnococcus provasolii, Strain RCC2336" /LENGTH=77 /DNA_ID=CAMNT_0007197383 /DNA_START=36 /DNA_END=269 /DNA_ORIENTATION=+